MEKGDMHAVEKKTILPREKKKEKKKLPMKKREKAYDEEKEKEVYSTRYSQAVTHPSTNLARRCLTSVIGREPVFSTWYGRRHWTCLFPAIYTVSFTTCVACACGRGSRLSNLLPQI